MSAETRSQADAQGPGGESIANFRSLLEPIMRGVAATFGRNCEVVLHDLQRPDGSIVAIEGNVTGRSVGGSMSQIGLGVIARGDDAEDQFNYITRTPSGRVLRSSTVILRDAGGHVLGLFCINFDITDLRLAAGALGDLVGPRDDQDAEPRPVAFVNDIDTLIRAVIDEEEVALGRPVDRMNKHDRLAIFQALNRRGVFSLQRSVPQVAEYLGISRATAYSYLEEIRALDSKAPRSRSDDAGSPPLERVPAI
jgi:predicted transcriptional regulator YheO